jgi:hypothetical protein
LKGGVIDGENGLDISAGVPSLPGQAYRAQLIAALHEAAKVFLQGLDNTKADKRVDFPPDDPNEP